MTKNKARLQVDELSRFPQAPSDDSYRMQIPSRSECGMGNSLAPAIVLALLVCVVPLSSENIIES